VDPRSIRDHVGPLLEERRQKEVLVNFGGSATDLTSNEMIHPRLSQKLANSLYATTAFGHNLVHKMNYSREPERDFAMSKYGQYCPVAQALDILGERWTLLMIRDMLTGTRHFSHLRRGLPGLSTALLPSGCAVAARGHCRETCHGIRPRDDEYDLTTRGRRCSPTSRRVVWGVDWAFGNPSPEQLDPAPAAMVDARPIDTARLPPHRVSIQFNFRGAKNESSWSS